MKLKLPPVVRPLEWGDRAWHHVSQLMYCPRLFAFAVLVGKSGWDVALEACRTRVLTADQEQLLAPALWDVRNLPEYQTIVLALLGCRLVAEQEARDPVPLGLLAKAWTTDLSTLRAARRALDDYGF